MRSFLIVLTLLALLAPTGVAADDYFVPLALQLNDQDGFDVSTFVTLTNATDEKVEFTSCFRGLNIDGSGKCGKKEVGPEGSLKSGETLGLEPANGEGFLGVLVIHTEEGALTASAQLRADAVESTITPELGAPADELAVLPVVSSRNAFDADEEVNLAAWFGPSSKSPFGHYVVNTSDEKTRCKSIAYDAKGKRRKKRNFSIEPMAMRSVPVKGPYRFTVSCDEAFYPFVWDFDAKGDDDPSLTVSLPSPILEKGLPNAASLGREGTCLLDTTNPKVWCKNDFKKIPYTVTKAVPVIDIIVNPPLGEYCRVVINFDMYVDGWITPQGFHELVYLAQKVHRDLIVYAGAFPPTKGNDLIIRHGYGLAHVDKPKIRSSHTMKPGNIYRVTYNYNPCNKRVQLDIVDDSGKTVAIASGVPYQPTPVASLSNNFFKFSFGRDQPQNFEFEPTPYGWIFANVALEFVLK